MQERRYISLVGPFIAVVAVGGLALYTDRIIKWVGRDLDVEVVDVIHKVTASLFWLAVAWLVSRLVDVFFWYSSVARRRGQAPPKLLVELGRLVIFLLTIGVIVTLVFHQPLTGLLVSSGAIGVVVGFALQRMISDFFSGIALSMERPFRVGDWIEVDGVVGQVIETNWRATHILTLERVTVVLPNSFIAERRFNNFNLPEAHFRTEIPVSLEYSVQLADAKRVLLAALRDVPDVLADPAPDVLFESFGNDGVIYRARFYIRNYREKEQIEDRVGVSISRHLWQAGMNVPYPKRDVYHTEMPPRDIDRKTNREALLSRVELFESLEGDDRTELAKSLAERRCRAGDDVVRQGDPGDSLFVVVDGLMEVKISNNGQTQVVARISPGEFFGEMSLLTGTPRAATVTAVTDATLYELSQEVLSPVLQRRPDVVEAISTLVAKRRVRNDASLSQSPDQGASHTRTLAAELLHRIRGFFNLDV